MPDPDLTVAPETMLAIRDNARNHLVRRVHRLRILARAFHKTGQLARAEKYKREAARTVEMIRSLDDATDEPVPEESLETSQRENW